MAKVKRIFDIAKELNISHIEIIDFLKNLDDSIKYTIMSSISNEIHAKILDHFYQDASAVDRLRKEMARLNVVHPNQDLADNIENETDSKIKDEESKVEDKSFKKLDDKPKRLETIPKLKIIKKASEDETNAIQQKNLDKKNDKNTDKKKSKKDLTAVSKPKLKLKKIDISSIADKINTTKKKQDNDSVKTSVSQLSKKVSKRKKAKKEEEIIEEVETKKIINIFE